MLIINSLWLIFSLIAFVLVTSGVGIWFLRLLRLKFSEKYWLSLDFFSGQIIVSSLAFLVNIVLPSPWNSLLYFFLIGLYLKKNISQIIKYLRKGVSFLPKSDSPIVILIYFVLILFFLRSFIKPYSWDDVVYHLPVVKELSQGGVHFPLLSTSPMLAFYSPISIFYGNLPYSSESFASVFYTITFKNINSIQLLYFTNFLIFLLFVYEFLIAEFKIRNITTAYITVLLLATLLDVALIISTGYIDLNVAIYQIVGLIMIGKAIQNRDIIFLYLSIFLLGYTAGIKYTALYIIPLYIIFYIYFLVKYRNKYNIYLVLFRTTALFLVSGGYWYIKNLVLFNNPIYPLYFNHVGISDSYYKLILDSQVNLGLPVSLRNFWTYIVNNYKDQFAILLTVPSITVLWLKGKNKDLVSMSLLLFGLFIFIVNFTFGSQILRFNILTSFAFIIVSAKIFDQSKTITSLTLVLLIIFIGFNPLQHSVWQAITNDVILQFSNKSVVIEKNKVGCATEVVKFAKDNNYTTESILNFWDPYASMVYENTNVFYKFNNMIIDNNITIPNQAKYLYSNQKYKNDFTTNYNFHRDINPLERDHLEESLNKTEVFKTGECVLYKI